MNKHRSPRGYIALIFFLTFIYGISNQAIGALITQIIAHYGIRMAQAGFLSSFNSVGKIAVMFVITIFVGKINKMILMGTSLFFYSVSLYMVSAAPPFSIILVSFALIGVFGSTLDTLTNSFIADLMPSNISRSISLLHGVFGLGGLCGPVIMERFAGNLNWAQIYFVLSLSFFIYLVIYAALVKWQWSLLTVRISNEKQVQVGFSDIVQFFTRRRNVLLWLTMFFYAGNQSTLAVWIKRYVEIHLNTPVWGAYALSAMWLGTAICRLVISPNINVSSSKKILFGNLISAVVLIAGLLSGSAKTVAAATLVVGLSSGLSVPLILAMGCEWYREKTAFGTVMPFTACFISYAVFPPLSGLVSDSLGMTWGVAVSAASAFLTVVFSGMLGANLKSAYPQTAGKAAGNESGV